MADLLSLSFEENINVIALDDGKANAMSAEMLAQINSALDAAESNGGLVLIKGREGVFSGGFDLGVFKRGDKDEIFAMLEAGAKLSERLLSFPIPTLAVCTGHAVAMGAFILLSTDYRIAVSGAHKFAANEVAIGLTVPRFAMEVCRQRLSPAAFNSGLPLARYFEGEEAQRAGFLDQICAAENLDAQVEQACQYFLGLDMAAHTATKLRIRAQSLAALRSAIEQDCTEWKEKY